MLANQNQGKNVSRFPSYRTVRFDLSDYRLLVIGQVKSDSFDVATAKLGPK